MSLDRSDLHPFGTLDHRACGAAGANDVVRGDRMTAALSGEPVRTLGHLPSLDGLRAVAVIAVMGYHANIAGFGGGRAGVDVFFVLSGFLITTLLLQERARSGRIGLVAFYMRRVLRLYPALVLAGIGALALAALKVPVFGGSWSSFHSTAEGIPFSLFYTMNIARAADWSSGGYLGHTWSLAIEEQFYLVWPLVVIGVMSRRSSPVVLGWVALACAVTSAVLRASLDAAGIHPELLYNATFSHVDGIFLGCALSVLWIVRPAVVRRLSHPAISAVAIAVSVAVVVRGGAMNTYGFAVIVLCTAAVMMDLLSRPGSRMALLLSRPSAVAVGKRSYGLYLYHWPIFLFVGIDTRPHVLALGFGASFVAAWISYRLVERPVLRHKARWSASREPHEGPGRTAASRVD